MQDRVVQGGRKPQGRAQFELCGMEITRNCRVTEWVPTDPGRLAEVVQDP
jgi:hypothetical protein